MSEPPAPGPEPSPGSDATLISSPKVETPTQSSLSPQERTSTGETKPPAPISTVVDVGSQLGPYQLVAKLGEGGMGAVFKARHVKLGKFVAMKILPQHVMSRPDALARFEREMLAVGSLHHPNIVQAHDAGEINGVHYLSMEYVEGQDLQQLVKASGPMSVVNACKAIRQAAQGLAAAHELGLVHRDIKPSNLFVTKKTGQIKILDMGLALLAQEEVPAALTSTGQCFGTPDYMAPEQWNDAHTCDARADLYSLGCTLFYLLVGHPPYPTETHRTAANKMKGHVIDPIPDLRSARSDVPPGLVAIYERLMAKQPEDRFASAAELVEALLPFASSKGAATQPAVSTAPESDLFITAPEDGAPVGKMPEVEAPALPLDPTSAWTPEPPAAAAVQSGQAPPPGSGRKRLLALGGAAAFVLLGVIIITITNKDGTKTKIEVPDTSKVEITTKGDDVAPKTGWQGWPTDAPKPAIAPFDADQAKKHQEEWAAYLKVPVEYRNAIGIKFRLIPPGEFTMGSTAEEIAAALKDVPDDKDWQERIKSEGPQHKVILTQPIYLGVNEVTQAEYEKVMGVNPSHFSLTGMGKEAVAGLETADHPVEMVSWNDAAEFCAKLSEKEKLKPFYFRQAETVIPLDGTGYRLPSEAEWEFACRAGTTTKYWIGDKDEQLIIAAWFGANSGGRTHAAGELKANPFGLSDIHGNVWEWVQDGWDATYYGQFQEKPAINPNSPFSAGSRRVIRGGGWTDTASICRSSDRFADDPTHRGHFIGFRVSLVVDAVRTSLKLTGPAMPKPMATTSSVPASDTAKLPASFTNSLGMEFVKVPKGTGWLGGGDGKPGEQKVEFTDDFYLGKYEVTQEEWEKITGLNPSHFSRNGGGKDAVKDVSDAALKRFPVEAVTWNDCQAFCEQLNKKLAEPGWVYRLPTANEREYACRGGPMTNESSGAFNFYFTQPSNEIQSSQSNIHGLSELLRPCRTGTFEPNILGLYDLHGNVWEWCADATPAEPGDMPSTQRWILVGGGFVNGFVDAAKARFRLGVVETERSSAHGLRVARVRVGTKSVTDPDRALAEWVLSLPGNNRVQILRHDDQQYYSIATGEQLPTLPFFVSYVFIPGGLSNEADFLRLGTVEHLGGFDVTSGSPGSNQGITDRAIEQLSRSPLAKSLRTFCCWPVPNVTDASIDALNRFQELENLNLSYKCQVTNAGFSRLRLPLLRVLRMLDSKVTTAGMKDLASRSPKLAELQWNFTPGPNENYAAIAELPLSTFHHGHTRLKPADLKEIARIRTLELLDIACDLEDEAAKSLRELVNLKSLFIGASKPVESAWKILAEHPQLTHLSTHDTVISDIGVESLSKSQRLKSLSIVNSNDLTDKALESLAQMTNLEELRIHCRQLTEPGVRKLQAALPKCKIESDFPDVAAIDFAAERKAAERLLKLHKGIVYLMDDKGGLQELKESLPTEPFFVHTAQFPNADVTDEELAALVGCRGLVELSLYLNPKVTPAGLQAIGPLPRLKGLNLYGTQCTRDGLEFVANYPCLESLYLLVIEALPGGAMRTLPPCPNLKVLTTTHTVGEEGLAHIATKCPALESLSLFDRTVSSIAPLAPLQKLRQLQCEGAQLTDAGIAVLAKRPDFQRLWIDSPDPAVWKRLVPLNDRLREIHIREQFTKTAAASIAIQPVSELNLLESVTIDGWIVVEADTLQRIGALPNLKALVILDSIPPDQRPAFRKYTTDDIEALRRQRPDVHFQIDGKDYPSSSAIPFSVIRKLDETDPLPKWELPEGSPPPVVAPCKPEEAAALQQKWAEHLQRPVVEEAAAPTGLGLKFALIPPGEFRKIFTRPGDPAIEPEMPVRRFRIAKPYAISTTEVTWDQFRQFVEATGYQTEAETNGVGGRDRAYQPDPKINWRNPGWKPAPNEPVTQVTPKDADAFCAWLTEANAKSQISNSKFLYRLPTEAEWLHACRAGSIHKHVVGPYPQDLADYAWTQEFLDPNPQASPLHLVAQKKPNPFGLHDTLGNVWEYTRDVLSPAARPYLPTNDPLAMTFSGLMGSAWSHDQLWGNVDFDFPYDAAQSDVGFRVLKQFTGEPLPGLLDRPLVLRSGQPLSVHALVPRPETIPGLQSWSIELASTHIDYANKIAASPKGDLIATANDFGKISLWDRDGNYQRTLLGHEGGITSLDFSPDGRWLASIESRHGGGTVRIWDVATGAVHAVIPSLASVIVGVRFSPDGKQLAVSMEAQHQASFFIIDLATWRMRTPVTGEQRGRALTWSPDSTKLAAASLDNRLRIWDAATLKVLQEVECPVSASLEWSPDGKWLATQAPEGKVAIRDAKSLELIRTFGSNFISTKWLPDSKRIVVAAHGIPYSLFDAATGEQLAKSEGPTSPAVAVIDEGKQTVVESGGRLHFYDTLTGLKLREGKERGYAGVTETKLSHDGQTVFTGQSSKIRRFDTATGKASEFEVPNHNISRLATSPDSKLVAASGVHLGFPMRILDATTGAMRCEMSHGKWDVTRMAWSPDGKSLATGATDKLVRVWNVATGKIEHELAGHTGTIRSLAWSPDGTRLASAAEDKTVRLWNPLVGKLVAIYDKFPQEMYINFSIEQNLAWATDSHRLWIALTNNIVPLDVETGTFGPLENFSNGNVVTFLNTSPDGQRLLARELYGWTYLRGRDAQDRRLLGQHLGQTAQWHPDSRRFLGWEPGYGTVGFDVEKNRRLGILFPWLTGDHWLCLGPTGHYRGSPGVEDQIVYVAMLPDGSQRTYSPAEFAKKFGWKNDLEKAELLGK